MMLIQCFGCGNLGRCQVGDHKLVVYEGFSSSSLSNPEHAKRKTSAEGKFLSIILPNEIVSRLFSVLSLG